MRTILALSVVALWATGCAAKDDAKETPGDGGAGTAGSGTGGAAGAAGAAGGGAGGAAGAAGAPGGAGGSAGAANDPCNGVSTTGQCVGTDKIETCLVSSEPDAAPVIKQSDCQPLTACQMVNGSAACVPTGDCLPGENACKNPTTLQTCDDTGHWTETACGADSCITQPGTGSQCLVAAEASGIFMKGNLQYELRKPNDATNPTDYSDTLSQEGAVDFFITIYDNNELIGMGLTSPGGSGKNAGDWQIEVDHQPTAGQTYVYFWPMLFDQSGAPFFALAKAKSNSAMAQQADEYWSWGFDGCTNDCTAGTVDVGTSVITEAMGSGGAHVYQWLDYSFFRISEMPDKGGTTPIMDGVKPLTLAIFWQPGEETASPPGIKFDCGNCFVPPGGGGAEVTYDQTNQLVDHYDSSLNISGREPDYRSHWSRSTLNHEFGHWAMQSYSRSPGEGGSHYVDHASIPGLAYSEAYATFSGQTNVSGGDNANGDPVYFTVQYGTGFWVNLSSAAWSDGPLDRPDPNGPIDQEINENIISSMMWSLWSSGNGLKPQSLGDAPVFSTLRSDRVLDPAKNRGYDRLDFIDFLDAMHCDQLADDSQIAAVADDMGYPWKASEATCQ